MQHLSIEYKCFLDKTHTSKAINFVVYIADGLCSRL